MTLSRCYSGIRTIAHVLILGSLFGVSLLAQVTTGDLAKVIQSKQLKHPYLYFTSEDKPKILERIRSNREAGRIMEGLLADGHRLLYVPVKDPPPARIKHPRYATVGDEANANAGELSEGAVKLAFLYQMTGEVKYAKKAIEFAVALCNLDSWVQQAHTFDIIYPRVWPWNVPDDRVVFSYDISTSDRTIAVSTVYDWVYPVLTKWERDKLRNGMLEKAITRVRGNYDYFWWSSAYRCNWSAICYSGLGITALSLMTEDPQLLDVVAEAYNRISLTMDQIGEDGAWQEGRGYYGYMMRVSVPFMDILKRMTGGSYNLFTHPKVKAHPFDFPLYGLTANFEDGEGTPVGPTAIINKLTQETKNGTAAWYREKFFGDGATFFDILWPRPTVEAVLPDPASHEFKSVNWAFLRSDFFDPAAVTIACKAGFNDDPHHGHLDCGQFILTWQGIPFIREMGRMRYDEQYFNEDRWLYPYASSRGHNLIFVNGEEQIPAKLKDQPWKEGLGGKILDFRTSSTRDYVLMDPSKAYPGKELKKWRRSIVLDKPATTLVLDEVESAVGAGIEARFFPGVASAPGRTVRDQRPAPPAGIEYKVFPRFVLLSGQRHRMALIPFVLNNNFTITEDQIAAEPVTEDARLSWVPYVQTVTSAKSGTSVLATFFVPVSSDKEAEDVAKTASITQPDPNLLVVSIDAPSGKFRWEFEKKKDGYVLKD